MAMIRDIHTDRVRQVIVDGILGVCRELGIDIIAEGIEVREEYDWLVDRGVRYIQGYLLAKPGFESLPEVAWPETVATAP
jgi:EAL domain-containing protein (putative c-di-GMP-specific phosphodiesterase class I)